MSISIHETTEPRDLIFISHASPDDNPMTVWLASRLTAAGYKIWNDVENLDGGDPFWQDIQEVLRHRTIKYLLLASHNSVIRTGVLTELQEASNVSKKLKDSRFIVPLRVDNLPWSEFPIQSNQSNGIDFSGDWGIGLTKLLSTLERDGIPRTATHTDIERVCTLYSNAVTALQPQEEVAILNKIRIYQLPDRIYYTHAEGASELELRNARKEITIPHETYGRLVVSFADHDALRIKSPESLQLTNRFDLSLDDFMAGGATTGPSIQKGIAQNIVSSIVRQAWEVFLEEKGLKRHNALLWYVPIDWLEKNKATFKKTDGTTTYRALAGKAKEHTWHFAIASRVLIREQKIQITPHVLFSGDGLTPYYDQKQLRRRHCKMWWNDTWRDRLQALVSTIFSESELPAPISLGGSKNVFIGDQLELVILPFSYSRDNVFVPNDEDDLDNYSDDESEAPNED